MPASCGSGLAPDVKFSCGKAQLYSLFDFGCLPDPEFALSRPPGWPSEERGQKDTVQTTRSQRVPACSGSARHGVAGSAWCALLASARWRAAAHRRRRVVTAGLAAGRRVVPRLEFWNIGVQNHRRWCNSLVHCKLMYTNRSNGKLLQPHSPNTRGWSGPNCFPLNNVACAGTRAKG